jgi:hypothetical protein
MNAQTDASTEDTNDITIEDAVRRWNYRLMLIALWTLLISRLFGVAREYNATDRKPPNF